MSLENKIADQQKFYKLNAGSICKRCLNVDNDCFSTFKDCATDKKSGFSFVKSCGSFNTDIVKKHSGYSIAAVKADTRIESMGGGFLNIDKHNRDK